MAEARIELTGIVAQGRHGANPGERLQPQEFLIDLDVLVDVGGDDLDRTLDYRAMVQTATATVSSTSFVLLETLAEAVARAVFELNAVLEATATVHKPSAAEAMGLDDVAVQATAGP
jgi:7,8-dihydroneopterin aldolase/epimerase/oxygenase